MADRGAAEYLSQHPLLNEIFDGLEREALERGISARPTDDETRRDAMHAVRALRSVREELARRAAAPTNRPAAAVV